ncbi:MAG: AmmeMemoRadiSam system radical SAM enzyme, partial [Deltaproteobacteria bacterium]|nr:AmmeMemoRadiSam system radical SAM enzyme [Deltaproteobacteria bacterium]
VDEGHLEEVVMAGEVEARLYERREDKAVRCYLCAHLCSIKEGHKGICGVREVREGTLYALDYGKLIARHIDPIEKKPFFHFQPGSASYSVATVGCNFRCLHCQNYEISQMPKESKKILGESITAEEVVEAVASTGCRSIAYTYTEPTIFFEFAYDCMKLAKERGMRNVFVTNGYMTRECLDEFKELLDGANVDVKAFTEGFYKRVCGAKLAPVLESVEYMRELGIWVEVTTLIIPTKNDSEEELREIARWIYRTDKKIPWHISAFYPTYKMN